MEAGYTDVGKWGSTEAPCPLDLSDFSTDKYPLHDERYADFFSEIFKTIVECDGIMTIDGKTFFLTSLRVARIVVSLIFAPL